MRRTKIVATLGPSTDDPAILERSIKAGVDVVRLNFSHGDTETHKKRAEAVHAISRKLKRHVGVLVDLQGPKIRIARFRGEGKVHLRENARFDLDTALPPDQGDERQVGCLYSDLPKDVKPGDVLLLDDGRIELGVDRIEGTRIVCRVIIGGELSNHKGINKQGGGLSAAALTERTRRIYERPPRSTPIILPYPFLGPPRISGKRGICSALPAEREGIVAKIERAEALEPGVIESIVDASDAIMVARGDLGWKSATPNCRGCRRI